MHNAVTKCCNLREKERKFLLVNEFAVALEHKKGLVKQRTTTRRTIFSIRTFQRGLHVVREKEIEKLAVGTLNINGASILSEKSSSSKIS